MAPLLDVILAHVPPPQVSLEQPFAMCVAMIERDPFVGRVATGGCRALSFASGSLAHQWSAILLWEVVLRVLHSIGVHVLDTIDAGCARMDVLYRWLIKSSKHVQGSCIMGRQFDSAV
jgi:hypothetical protein